jgi:hypothetical protein
LDGAGLGGLLQTRCQMRGHAHRRVADGQIIVDRPDHDLAGIQADPQPYAVRG